MKARLLAAGMRPISNVVDVTNYVMLALGSPLHAFDMCEARRRTDRGAARAGRREDHDPRRRRSHPHGEDLVIADATRAVAIAGIMGGEDSEVRPRDHRRPPRGRELRPADGAALLPRGCVFGRRPRRGGRRAWIRMLAEQAAVYATELFVKLGARWTGHTDQHAGLPERPTVRLRPELADRLVGLEFPVKEQRETLTALGFEVADDGTVTVPTWRARDVTRTVDLVEEVARFRMHDVPARCPLGPQSQPSFHAEQRLRRQVEEVLVGAGFYEVIHVDARARRGRKAPARGAVLARNGRPSGRPGAPVSSSRPRATETRASSGSHSSRSPTSSCRRRRRAPARALARRRHRRGRFLPCEGRCRGDLAVYRALGFELDLDTRG